MVKYIRLDFKFSFTVEKNNKIYLPKLLKLIGGMIENEKEYMSQFESYIGLVKSFSR